MSESRVLYGFHAVTGRLRRHPESVREIYIEAGRHDGRARDLLARAQTAGVRVIAADMRRLEQITGTHKHQGVAARVAEIRHAESMEEVLRAASEPVLLLVLDGVQDPHNLGACLRVADAFGAHAVVAPKDRAVGMTPTVSKVASGAADTVPYLQVTNLARCLRDLQQAGLWILGADQEGNETITAARLEGSVAWVLGAEGEGLRRLTREHCDAIYRIPMQGTVASLNVSVAAGICLFETRRQRASTGSALSSEPRQV